MAEVKTTTVAVVKKEVIDVVMNKVKTYQSSGEIQFHANYVPENALKSAWLMLLDTVDKNKNPVLEVCTMASIANALLGMVIQGLNPDKKQCYFIAYGTKLGMQRSYFGSIHVAKSVNDTIEDVFPSAVYEGDELEYKIIRGRKSITNHTQKLENVKKDNITAAYACVLYKDGTTAYEIMTIEEIKQAWKQSKMNPVDEKNNIKKDSTHGKFTADMAMKTVANKACKLIINTSDDEGIVASFAKKNDVEIAQLEADVEIIENANTTLIDTSDMSGTESHGEEPTTTDSTELTKEEQAEIAKAEKSGAGF